MRCSPLLKLFKPGSQTVQQLYQVRFLCFKFPHNPLKLSLTREIDIQKKLSNFAKLKFLNYSKQGHLALANLAKLVGLSILLLKMFCKITPLFLCTIISYGYDFSRFPKISKETYEIFTLVLILSFFFPCIFTYFGKKRIPHCWLLKLTINDIYFALFPLI